MRSWDRNGNLGLSTFWLRRFRRLLPAVIHTLVSVLIVTASLRKQDLGSTLAERSYCIYLCHMPVIAFMPHSWLEQHQFWASLITVVVSVLLAAVSWSWIEDPIRKDGIVEPVRAWRRTQNERPFPPGGRRCGGDRACDRWFDANLVRRPRHGIGPERTPHRSGANYRSRRR